MNTRGIVLVAIVLALIAAGAFLAFRPSGSAPYMPPPQEASLLPSKNLEDSGPYHEITLTYPSHVALRSAASRAAKASAEAVIDAWVKETAATFKANANIDALSAEDIRMQGLDKGRKYVMKAAYEEYAGPATISYVFEVYEDTLGAHPNAYYRSFTFDATTGTELRIADLFEGTSYLETLSRVSREMLVPQIAKMTDVPEEELDTSYIESGTTPDQNNFQVFYLTSTDLVIVFPPYQVGPWVLGTQTVTIPRAELEKELKAAYR